MTTGQPSTPRKLERGDDLEFFDSGAEELDNWLRKFAYTNLRANNAISYVTLDRGRVVGYYAIAVAAVEKGKAPARLATPDRPQQIPCILLARLAVDKSMQGKRIGAALLRDSLQRAATLSESVGAAAVLIHARDEDAKNFYLANGDFLESPVDPLHLMIPMKDVRRLFLS